MLPNNQIKNQGLKFLFVKMKKERKKPLEQWKLIKKDPFRHYISNFTQTWKSFIIFALMNVHLNCFEAFVYINAIKLIKVFLLMFHSLIIVSCHFDVWCN